ncbi:restriction endonuclease subunit S [uncultured Nostoc sp.]|uniref:restriction endonuclease subunit S n=1 Tax=uncultured Nostoc sp. TaxID=340711 RepID=UPI002630D3DC|nr:restriction endonuclease subunit S [uncultured Nostoc sp.]
MSTLPATTSKKWAKTTIGESLKLKSGDFLSAANMDKTGKYPVYGGNGITGYHSSYLFEDRKIVIGRVGLYCGSVHYTLPYSWITDNALYVFKKDSRFLDEYLIYALRSANLNQYASQSGQPLISEGRLENVEIIIPPILEQKRIVTLLEKSDRLRRTRRYALQLSNTFLQSVFLQIFGDPINNPMGWNKSFLDEISEVQGGLQLSKKRDNLPLKLPYLRVANIYRNQLELSHIKTIGLTEEEFKRIKLQTNDILIVEGHGNIEEIGRCAIWDNSIKDCVHQNHLIRVRVNTKIINNIYLSHYINNSGGKKYFNTSSNTTSGLNTISTGIVKKCIVPLPPPSAPRKIRPNRQGNG